MIWNNNIIIAIIIYYYLEKYRNTNFNIIYNNLKNYSENRLLKKDMYI